MPFRPLTVTRLLEWDQTPFLDHFQPNFEHVFIQQIGNTITFIFKFLLSYK